MLSSIDIQCQIDRSSDTYQFLHIYLQVVDQTLTLSFRVTLSKNTTAATLVPSVLAGGAALFEILPSTPLGRPAMGFTTGLRSIIASVFSRFLTGFSRLDVCNKAQKLSNLDISQTKLLTIQFTVHCMSLSGPHQMAPVHNVVSSAA